jgi:diguanylate cyclase (GGDEF)-like protein/PAS domain S-box-containing protein
VGSWAWLVSTGELWWSDETYRICGRTPGESTPTYDSFLAAVHPDDRAEVERRAGAALEGTEVYDGVHRLVHPSGEVRHVHEYGTVLRAPDGTPVRLLGFVQDVTEEVVLRRTLAEREELYRLLAENAWDVIWTMELDGSISYISPAIERVRGLTPEEAMTQTLDEIHPAASAARVGEYFGRLFEAIATGSTLPEFHGEQEYFRKDGSIMNGELDVVPQVDAEGNVVRILGVTRDISERREYEEKLNRLAVTDSLTGVWNRRQGEELLTADMYDARRYGPAMSLLMLDLDHFKDINDTHGHKVGDLVLIELCRRLTAHLRASDVLVRWGGEEFVILMRQCTLDQAVPRADTLRALVADVPFADVGTVTVSIGVAELQTDDDLATWMRRADLAMYDAKSNGRNTVRPDT